MYSYTFLKMPCPAIKQSDGNVCGIFGTEFEGYCKRHFNVMNKKPEFRARHVAFLAAEEARRTQVQQGIAAARAARVAAEAVARQGRRLEQIAKNERTMTELADAGSATIYRAAVRLITVWKQERLEGYDCIKAYVALKYKAVVHPGLSTLLRAATRIYLQTAGNHPDYVTYTLVPADERNTALLALKDALVPYGEFNPLEFMQVAPVDKFLRDVLDRQAADARAAAAAAAAVAAAAAAAQRQAELLIALREEPVVFSRDPEGGIDLRALGADPQSVHRSSVQNGTEKAVHILLKRTVDLGQETLPEIVMDFNNPKKIRFTGNSSVKDNVITELTNDYFNVEAFSVMYGDVLDRVWTYIRNHTERTELVLRLAQEVLDGRGQCTNGKMARLVNVLRGFDSTLEDDVAPKVLFYGRFALLKKKPKEERESLANALFTEFHIPVEERNTWLEPLMEHEE